MKFNVLFVNNIFTFCNGKPCTNKNRKKQVKIKRSKGYGTDLDRIEIAASPTGVILTEDQRRHSIVIQVYLLFWIMHPPIT